ncbi:MAG TPA: HAD-IC family P-type ATPase [Chthonomonadales bacterium]|nr:HAD-IC family P-type ATPase [Chthonomonadales bacterium]
MTLTKLQEAEVCWHAAPVEQAAALAGDLERGLSDEEATRRRAEFGLNVIERRSGDSPLRVLWRQIDNPLIWVLIASSAIAIALGKVGDGLVVMAVVVLNTLIGFVQEYRAGKAIEALSAMVPENATVTRDGRQRVMPVAELVPGDVVAIAAGDKVPADVRLVQARNLNTDEAALTGESTPVSKTVDPVGKDAEIGDRLCLAFSGTLVTSGAAVGVVVATGYRTELGRISSLLEESTDLQTPLTRALAQIGKVITIAIGILAVAMLAVGMARAVSQGSTLFDAFRDSLLFAIALAVGAIPEGLPAIVTIALAIGVQRMAARRAIIRKLPAVETLGSTSVICSDKTGTLTRNEMTVTAAWTDGVEYALTGVGYRPEGHVELAGKRLDSPPEVLTRLLLHAALCSDATLREEDGAWHITGDPTEGALVAGAEKVGLRVDDERRAWARVDSIPFESENQYMATLHRRSGRDDVLVMKGAPEVVLQHCAIAPEDREKVLSRVEGMAGQGLRMLAVASRHANGAGAIHESSLWGLQFDGVVGMIDPPRPEAIAAVETCRRAGIEVKMITGDHRATAEAIGAQLGLATAGRAVTGAELQRTTDDDLRRVANETRVFARVAPEHKLRLVRALQAEEHVVAMTGDGVNDAPALSQANIGVAMGITGTSVSKESSDMVLTDDNFATIAAAVEEGRRVYDNLIKSLAFVLPTNLGLALILTCAVAFFPFDADTSRLLIPMQPIQLLWINLVAAVALALPLAFEHKEPDVMDRPPRSPREPVLSRFVLARTVLVAVMMASAALALFLWEYNTALAAGVALDDALAKAQTMAVTTVTMFQIFYLFNCRSLRDSVLRIGLFSNPVVYLGVGTVLLLHMAFVYAPVMNRVFGTTPITVTDLGFATLVSMVVLPVISLEKWWRGRSRARATAAA